MYETSTASRLVGLRTRQQWRRTCETSSGKIWQMKMSSKSKNEKKRPRGSSSSSNTPESPTTATMLENVLAKLETFQAATGENFAKTMKEINQFRTEIIEQVGGLKTEVKELTKSLEAAWEEVEDLKAKDRERDDTLQRLTAENEELKKTFDSLKERAIKQENYTRRENIRIFNMAENQDENCEEKVKEMLNALNIKKQCDFHAVHRVGGTHANGKPRTIIARFLNRADRNLLWNRRKELVNTEKYKNIILAPDYAPETAEENRKLSKALYNAKQRKLTPAFIRSHHLFVQGRKYDINNIPVELMTTE